MLISEGQKVCTLKNVMVLCVGCILLFYICNDHNRVSRHTVVCRAAQEAGAQHP